MTYLWVLSLMALPLSNLPNRILLGLLLIWFITNKKLRALDVPHFKWLAASALVLLVLSTFTNKVLSKELLLALSIPSQGLFLVISRPSSSRFKKGFHAAMMTVLFVLFAFGCGTILQTGFTAYFEQDQWWNLWHYKSFTEPLSLHPTYLSLFLLTGMTFLLFGTESPSLKEKFTVPGMMLFVFYLLGIWLISAKIALMAVALILFVFLVYKVINGSTRQSIATVLLLLISISLPLASPSIRYRLTHELKNAKQSLPAEVPNRISERRALWKASFLEMDKHPIAGTSLRGLESREAIYPKAKFFYPPLEKPMNAHNNFIEFGLRYGILFGVLLLLSSIFGLYRVGRVKSLELFNLGILFLTVSMTESFLFREQGLSLTAMILLFFLFDRK